MKHYWALWDFLYLRNGVLNRKWDSEDGKTFKWLLILPKTRVSTVLKELHYSPTGGYFGVMKTLQKVFQHWISRFGVPLQLHSDEGRNFDSAVYKRLCEIFVIDKTRTTALLPQSDGMVERFNLIILNSLSLLVSSNQQDGDKKLPWFLLAYRSAVNETTGYSPSQTLFGRDLRLPADLLFSRPPNAPLAPEEYIEKLQEWMEKMHHLASERIGMASKRMKTRFDARAIRHDFHEGDKVWLWNPKRQKRQSPKLHTTEKILTQS
ncbi:retrovirus-related Pol polyprotein from transposon 412 [Trichonephila clavipes]|nr:retrovirus-related Pol polyprotein from transposon 412 [Trichonephila clavipes]